MLPLTKPAFINKVRQVLQAISLLQKNFAGRSFRIGAATSAAQAGIEDSIIRKMEQFRLPGLRMDPKRTAT